MSGVRTTYESAHDGVNALSGKTVCDKIYMAQLQLVAAYCNRNEHFTVVCALSSLNCDCIVLEAGAFGQVHKGVNGN